MLYFIYLILIFFILFDYKKNKNIFSPVKVFNFIWLITLLLYSFKLSYVQRNLSLSTECIFLIIILSYDIFYFIFEKFKFRNIKFKLFTSKYKISTKIKMVNLFFILLFLIECIYCKGFPLLFSFTKGNNNYLNYGIPSLHGFLNCIAICMGSYYLFKKDPRKYIYIIFALLTLSRQVFMSFIVEGIVYYFFTKLRANHQNNIDDISVRQVLGKSILKFFILFVVLIILFSVVGNFRSGSNTMKIVFRPLPNFEKLPTSIMWIYSYMTFSLSNFDKLVSMTSGFVNYGASTLNFFLPTVIINSFNLTPNWNENYLVQSNFNVSTAFPEIYLDFGVLGLILFSIFISYFGNKLYRNLKKDLSDKNILMFAVYIHNIIFIFFVNMFLYIPIFFQFIFIPLIFREEDSFGKD